MITNPREYYISPEEYIEKEKVSQIKHEYINGQIYAMAGASDAHNTISGNLFSKILNHLGSKGCRVYMSDMKVQIDINERYYYPDVMVTCDKRDKEFDYFKKYPCLIIEVLSDTTEAFDRGKKFTDYRSLKSLEEYVLVSQDSLYIESYRRNQEGRWELYTWAQGNDIEFATIDFRCPIDEIYRFVDL